MTTTAEWYVYILQCADNTFYTGITTDIERRCNEHNTTVKGAKYTRARRPVKIVYTESHNTRSEASKRECEIKTYSHRQKKALIDQCAPMHTVT